ncbi:MAG TPA: LCP family protein [Arachnia sp.]|nr:LCP family protein [Arachnia sp.]HMT85161.1 LCP family protein [Arachnia sp.]
MSDEKLPFFDENAGTERPQRAKRSRRPLVIGLSILLVVLVAIGAVVAFYVKSGMDALDQVQRNPDLTPTSSNRPAPVDPQPGAKKAPTNFVLMGSDSQGDERGRSDVLQLLHLPGSRDAAYLLSIPRDSWVDIPGHGKGKINWAYSFGGPALTVDTLESLLDVPMDHTVIIDFDGFKNVIDALGGVTVYNRHASASLGYTFPEGEIRLSGEEALVFVRERYNLPSGDFDRAERQRDVIKGIVKQLASAGVLANPATFSEVVSALGPQFTVDEALTNNALIELAMGSSSAFGNIHSMGLPNLGPGWAGTQSIVQVDWEAMEQLKLALRNDDMQSFFEAHGG